MQFTSPHLLSASLTQPPRTIVSLYILNFPFPHRSHGKQHPAGESGVCVKLGMRRDNVYTVASSPPTVIHLQLSHSPSLLAQTIAFPCFIELWVNNPWIIGSWSVDSLVYFVALFSSCFQHVQRWGNTPWSFPLLIKTYHNMCTRVLDASKFKAFCWLLSL